MTYLAFGVSKTYLGTNIIILATFKTQVTMGKKSKKKSAGPNKAAVAGPSAANLDAAAAAARNNGGGILTGGKKLKCVRCYGNIKDLEKAHQCPGCSNLHCWRCERKCFEECPSGSDCMQPLRRRQHDAKCHCQGWCSERRWYR